MKDAARSDCSLQRRSGPIVAVKKLHRDTDTIGPSMARLVSTERDHDVLNNTHKARLLNGAMKFAKEGRLELATRVISGILALRNLVDTLKRKRPRCAQKAEVEDTIVDVSSIVMVGLYDVFAIYLCRDQT